MSVSPKFVFSAHIVSLLLFGDVVVVERRRAQTLRIKVLLRAIREGLQELQFNPDPEVAQRCFAFFLVSLEDIHPFPEPIPLLFSSPRRRSWFPS